MKLVKYKQLSSLSIAQKRQVSCLTGDGKFYGSSLIFKSQPLHLFSRTHPQHIQALLLTWE